MQAHRLFTLLMISWLLIVMPVHAQKTGKKSSKTKQKENPVDSTRYFYGTIPIVYMPDEGGFKPIKRTSLRPNDPFSEANNTKRSIMTYDDLDGMTRYIMKGCGGRSIPGKN